MKNDDDEFLTVILVVAVVAIFGPGLAAHFVPQVSGALLRWHILAGDGILIPIGAGAGLDLARVAIAVGVLALIAVLAALLVRSKLRGKASA